MLTFVKINIIMGVRRATPVFAISVFFLMSVLLLGLSGYPSSQLNSENNIDINGNFLFSFANSAHADDEDDDDDEEGDGSGSPTLISGSDADFEGLAEESTITTGNWVNTAGDDNDCWRAGTVTPTAGTGPTGGAESSAAFAYFEASGACTAAPGTAYLLGPAIDFDTTDSVNIDFWWHQLGNNIGTLDLELSADGGSFASPTNLFTQSGGNVDIWFNEDIDLSAFDDTGTRTLRFVQSGNTGPPADSSVDQIEVFNTPDDDDDDDDDDD